MRRAVRGLEYDMQRKAAIRANRVRERLAFQVRGYAIHKLENEARPGANRVQPGDVDFVRNAVNAPDVNMFLAVI